MTMGQVKAVRRKYKCNFRTEGPLTRPHYPRMKSLEKSAAINARLKANAQKKK